MLVLPTNTLCFNYHCTHLRKKSLRQPPLAEADKSNFFREYVPPAVCTSKGLGCATVFQRLSLVMVHVLLARHTVSQSGAPELHLVPLKGAAAYVTQLQRGPANGVG